MSRLGFCWRCGEPVKFREITSVDQCEAGHLHYSRLTRATPEDCFVVDEVEEAVRFLESMGYEVRKLPSR